MKPKLLIIIDQLGMGGAEIFVIELYSRLAGGYDIYLLALRKSDKNLARKAKKFCKKVIILNLNFKKPFGITKIISKKIDSIKPEIIHTHLNYADLYGRLAAKRSGIKNIFSTVHSLELWRGNIFNPAGLRTIIFDRYLSASTKKIVAISGEMADVLEKKEKIAKQKICLIHNGVNTEKFRPESKDLNKMQELGLDKDKITVGFIGRLEPPKGLDIFFKALEKIRKLDFQVLIIGDGSLRDELEKSAWKLKPVKTVFTGCRTDIAKLLNIIDVFVLPSNWEGLPISLLEAMACQKIIIATNIPGIREVVSSKEGLLVPTKNPKRLGQCLAKVITQKNDFQPMALKAREKIIRKFSLERAAQKYNRLYNQALDENSGR